MKGQDLSTFPVHLGRGGSASTQPAFTGAMQWYADYASRNANDGADGRLVTLHTFSAPWNMWEMHPVGAEVVVCTSGSLTLLQEQADGSTATTVLNTGEYAINPPGVWHTADADAPVTALFITAGEGTEHRPR